MLASALGHSMGQPDDDELANRILLALPRATLQRISPYIEHVALHRGQVIYHPDAPIRKLYFVNRGLVSLVRTMRDGRTDEIGAIGIEGVTGLPALFGIDSATLECIVQVPGNAFCGTPDVLRPEMGRSRSFSTLLLHYYHLVASQIAQTAACNRLHSLEERCCRWLLIAHDSARSDSFPLTHEFLSMMLGVQRAGVSIAANALQQTGVIRYARGHMTITDRPGLEAAACECYDTIHRLVGRLFRS
jgi:CRP-like cAMP-binding protein